MPYSIRVVALLAMMLVATACTSNDSAAETIAVRSTGDACEVAATAAPSGTVVFAVTNDGTAATEFYLYAGDGTTIIGEVEDIGPGLTRNLTVDVTPGNYVTACKPGMVGDGIRGGFTVLSS